MKKNKQKGGVALEYLLVSLFAFVMSTVAIGIIIKTYNSKIKELGEEFNITINPIEFNKFP